MLQGGKDKAQHFGQQPFILQHVPLPFEEIWLGLTIPKLKISSNGEWESK